LYNNSLANHQNLCPKWAPHTIKDNGLDATVIAESTNDWSND